MDWSYVPADEGRNNRKLLRAKFAYWIAALCLLAFLVAVIVFVYDHSGASYSLSKSDILYNNMDDVDMSSSLSQYQFLRAEMDQRFKHIDSVLRIISAQLAARPGSNDPILPDGVASWEDFRWEDFKKNGFSKVWAEFKQTHNKTYEGEAEENERKDIFFNNYMKIIEHNRLFVIGERSYELKMNKYGDLKHEEFRKLMNGFRRPKVLSSKSAYTFMPVGDRQPIPKSVDWRDHGYVTPVKDQKHCGSCWAFSATGALEGQEMRKYGRLVSLSEQNLVDCSRKYGNMGCNGGLMDQAFDYVKDNNGIDTEASYPYEATEKRCRFKNSTVGATDSGYVDIPKGNETLLMQAVAMIGPISVAIDASHESFQFYHKGVYFERSCSSEDLDHGVLVVGYGTLKGRDYWIVKNSWSENWGDSGYILMARNKRNLCGIASSASYPIV